MTSERLFLALWPDAAVRAALAASATNAVRGGRIVGAANLHLTLVFLGSVDMVRRACVEDVCAAVSAPRFELSLVELHGRARSGIVWIAPVRTPEALRGLVDALSAGLGRCGFVREARPFRAHVTLARDVRRAIAPQRLTAIRWKVREFCLVASRPQAEGSAYTVQRSWPLGSATGNA